MSAAMIAIETSCPTTHHLRRGGRFIEHAAGALALVRRHEQQGSLSVDRRVDRHVETKEDDHDEVSEHAGDAAQGGGRRLQESGRIWEEAAHHGADPTPVTRFLARLSGRASRTLRRCQRGLPVRAGRLRIALRCEALSAGRAPGAAHLAAERVQLPLHSRKKLVRLLGDGVPAEADPDDAEDKQGDAHHGQAPAAGYCPDTSEALRAGIEEHGEQEPGEHEKEAARGAPDEEQGGSRGERHRHNLESRPAYADRPNGGRPRRLSLRVAHEAFSRSTLTCLGCRPADAVGFAVPLAFREWAPWTILAPS